MGRSLSGCCTVCGADVGELCRYGCTRSETPAAPRGYSRVRWVELLDETFEEIRKLGALKGGEYSGDTDRLANFRRNGAALGLPMETVWAVYAGKHWDAIMQYIRDQREGVERQRLEPIEGRVDDLLVYLLLLKAMLEEGKTGG